MNKLLLATLLTIFMLSGCNKPPDAADATPVAAAPASAAGDLTGSAPATFAADAAPATAVDDDTAINASIDKLLGDHARYRTVIQAYQKAIADSDKAAVAALVDYPIEVDIDGSKTLIKDPAAFVRNYDKVITPAIARKIEAQKYSELLVNSKGVMFGNGETWINGICREGSADCSEFEVKIVAIQAGASN